MGSAKTPLAEYFADKGFWPTMLSDVLGNSSGKYTGTVSGVDTGTIAGTASGYSVEATMRTAGVNAAITGGKIRLHTLDAGKNWTCTIGAAGATGLSSKCRAPAAKRAQPDEKPASCGLFLDAP